MDRDNQDAAALRDYGDEEPTSVASPKVNSKVNALEKKEGFPSEHSWNTKPLMSVDQICSRFSQISNSFQVREQEVLKRCGSDRDWRHNCSVH